jgi:hypothetical protein
MHIYTVYVSIQCMSTVYQRCILEHISGLQTAAEQCFSIGCAVVFTSLMIRCKSNLHVSVPSIRNQASLQVVCCGV